MSSSSKSTSVQFLRRSGTFMTAINCQSGDLFQEYVENAGSIVVTPDFSQDKPVLEFTCISSRVATGEYSITSSQIRWFMNDTEIEFGSDGYSTGVYAGLFYKTQKQVSTNVYRQQLQIVKSIATAAGYAAATIKAVAVILSGTVSDTLQATYTIPIGQRSGNTHKVTIAAGDTSNFVISQKGGSCILKAVTYYNGVAADSSQLANLSYKWYKFNGTTWTLQTTTTQTLTVKESEIDTYANFKVEVYETGATEPVGSDTQGVMDSTDPYVVSPGATPSSETIEEGSGDSVVYEPKIISRSTGAEYTPRPLFDFYAVDVQGGYVGKAESASTFTVTEQQCRDAGGDVLVTITSKDF